MVSSHAPIETGYVNDTVSDSNATGPSPSGKGMSFVEAGLNDIQDIAKKGMAAAADVASKLGFPSLSTEQPQLLAGATDGRQSTGRCYGWSTGAVTRCGATATTGFERRSGTRSEKTTVRWNSERRSGTRSEETTVRWNSERRSGTRPEETTARWNSERRSGTRPEETTVRWNSGSQSGRTRQKPPVESPAPPNNDSGVGSASEGSTS